MNFSEVNTAKLFHRVIRFVFAIMLLFIVLGIMVGVLRLFLNLGSLLMNEDITRHYMSMISEVLTLFILIELSRSEEIYALSTLMFVLGGLRIGSVMVFQREKAMFDQVRKLQKGGR